MTIKLRYLGHASFKMKIDDKIIYIDPHGGEDSFYAEKANLILCTHKHQDHSDPKKIALIQEKKTTIVTSSDNAPNLKGNVVSLDPGQEFKFDSIIIYGVHAYNVKRFRSPNEPFHPKGMQTAFIIETKGRRFYFAGDTDFIEEMKDLKDIELAILPIDGKYTMDPKEALEAIGAFKPQMVIPMHWREQDPLQFKKDLRQKYPEIASTVLNPNQVIEI